MDRLSEELLAEAIVRAEKVARRGDGRCFAMPHILPDALASCTPKRRCKVGWIVANSGQGSGDIWLDRETGKGRLRCRVAIGRAVTGLPRGLCRGMLRSYSLRHSEESQVMKPLLVALLLVLPITFIAGESDQIAQARLRKFTKTSTVPQQNHDFRDAHGFQISGINPDQPFTFQKVDKIRKITRIKITLTLYGGNTGPGDIDENQLTLALDGIDTGLVLNGFRGGDHNDTQTISGPPINESQIRAALKADGKLHATIIDADPAADINRPNGCSCFDTTLVLTGKAKR